MKLDPDYCTNIERIDKALDDIDKKMSEIKSKKYIRDQKDYKEGHVYDWAATRALTRQPRSKSRKRGRKRPAKRRVSFSTIDTSAATLSDTSDGRTSQSMPSEEEAGSSTTIPVAHPVAKNVKPPRGRARGRLTNGPTAQEEAGANTDARYHLRNKPEGRMNAK